MSSDFTGWAHDVFVFEDIDWEDEPEEPTSGQILQSDENGNATQKDYVLTDIPIEEWQDQVSGILVGK